MYGIATLSSRVVNFVSSRVTSDGTHVVVEAVRVQAILKSFLVVSSMQMM